MKKVGILTFHDAHNYGAVLQAYALKKYIKDLGMDVSVINYHHSDIPDGFPKQRPFDESMVEEHKYSEEDHNSRWDKFDTFIKELINNEDKVYTSEEELEKLNIDYWICGSDQIWNTDITRGFNRGFFLDFDTTGTKITYAVSMGIPKLEEHYEEKFSDAVNKIHHLGVREETLKEYVKGFTEKEVVKTVDPTLLLKQDDYNDLLVENQIKDKYVLIYALGPDERLTEIAKKKAEEKGLKIVELNDMKKKDYFCEQVSNAGPEEFLTLIKNAEVIVTNSFHGTIFSAIFGKDFYTLTRLNRNSRMENILDILGMRDRLLDKVEDLDKVKEQDYIKAYENLEKETKKSKEFLHRALKLEE